MRPIRSAWTVCLLIAVVTSGEVPSRAAAPASQAPAAAQTPPQNPLFRGGVDLIAVDVQVVDKDGRPVRDLTPHDFQVSLSGQQRTVVSADLIQYGQTTTPPVATRVTGATPAAPVTAPATTEPGRYIIVAIDGFTFDAADARGVAKAAQGFVDRLQANDQVGVFAYPVGPKLDPTPDHQAVQKALSQVVGARDPQTGQVTVTPSDIVDITSGDPDARNQILQSVCDIPLPTQGRATPRSPSLPGCGDDSCTGRFLCEVGRQALSDEAQVQTSLGMLGTLLRNLARVPGRKIVVLVSAGLPVSDRPGARPDVGTLPQQLGQDAARSNVTMYTLFIDQSLLQQNAAENPHGVGGRVNAARDSHLLSQWLDLFSGSTGGTLMTDLVGSGDIVFDRILLETSAYYLLGVKPDAKDRDGHAHQLKVKVDRSGVTLRSRTWAVVPVAAIAGDAPGGSK